MLHACHDDESMLDTTLTPIVKTKTGDVTDKNNDRPIAVATSMSKVMELLILSKTECFLNTSDNQFGFKKKHGTDMCIHTFRQTIEYYKQNSSPVFICYLDATVTVSWLRTLLSCKSSSVSLHTWHPSCHVCRITRQSCENSSSVTPSMSGCINMLKHSPPSNR